MALTGKLEVFPLPEVLRLLARSGRNGCLRVDAGSVDGRIYLREGALALATVSTDGEIIDQLVSSGVVDGQRVERMGSDDVVLPDLLAPGRSAGDLTDFVREHVVEALYRIRRPGQGAFEFLVDAGSRFDTGQAFDTEAAVSEADRRAHDWAEIEQTIADMHLPVRMVRELKETEVTINAPTWRVLASLEAGLSVAQIAKELGTTEFRAAREIAGLMRSSLIEPLESRTTVESSPATEPSSWFHHEAQPTPSPAVDEPEEAPAEHSPWTTDDTPETATESPSWTDQPWSRPVEPDAEADVETAAASGEEPATAESRGGWWAEAMGESDLGEVDTDEFLESVFSTADGVGEGDEEETGFSMGLLRRRRMGPTSRDLSGE
jgi:hypothetical protein